MSNKQVFISKYSLYSSRVVTVKGPRGELTKSFKHLALDLYMTDKVTIKVEKWFGKKKQIAAVRTTCSHINNMFKGVTQVGVCHVHWVP